MDHSEDFGGIVSKPSLHPLRGLNEMDINYLNPCFSGWPLQSPNHGSLIFLPLPAVEPPTDAADFSYLPFGQNEFSADEGSRHENSHQCQLSVVRRAKT